MLYICTAIYLNIFVTTSISTSIYLYLHYIKYINLIKKYKIKESKKKKKNAFVVQRCRLTVAKSGLRSFHSSRR